MGLFPEGLLVPEILLVSQGLLGGGDAGQRHGRRHQEGAENEAATSEAATSEAATNEAVADPGRSRRGEPHRRRLVRRHSRGSVRND
jgi:hypothetical protein